MQTELRRRLAASPFGRSAALPLRTMAVARYDARLIGRSIDWLVHDRETHNYTYDLEDRNLDQLCWFVAAITGAEIEQVRAWMEELDKDEDLISELTKRLSANPFRSVHADRTPLGPPGRLVRAGPCDRAGARGGDRHPSGPRLLHHRRRPAAQRARPPDHDRRRLPTPGTSSRSRGRASSTAGSGARSTSSPRCGTSACSCTTACTRTTTRPVSSPPSSRTCGPTPSSCPTTPMTHPRCPSGPNGPDVITCSSRSSRADHWWPGDGIGVAWEK